MFKRRQGPTAWDAQVDQNNKIEAHYAKHEARLAKEIKAKHGPEAKLFHGGEPGHYYAAKGRRDLGNFRVPAPNIAHPNQRNAKTAVRSGTRR